MNVEKLKLAWTPCTYVHCSSFIMTRVFITCLASHWKTHRQTLVTTADVPADIPRRRHPPPPEDTLKAAAAKKSFQTLASAKMHSPAWLLTSFYCKMSNCNLDHREDLSRLEFWFQKIRNSLLFFKAKDQPESRCWFCLWQIYGTVFSCNKFSWIIFISWRILVSFYSFS